jgi:hypothetical protein
MWDFAHHKTAQRKGYWPAMWRPGTSGSNVQGRGTGLDQLAHVCSNSTKLKDRERGCSSQLSFRSVGDINSDRRGSADL